MGRACCISFLAPFTRIVWIINWFRYKAERCAVPPGLGSNFLPNPGVEALGGRKSCVLARVAGVQTCALPIYALYPDKSLQEREVAGVYFIARYGAGLLHQLFGAIHTDCLDHQLVSLQS